MKLLMIVLFFLGGVPNIFGQTISASIPKEVKPGEKYLFYLHGAIVQSQGKDAISPYWGRYEYMAILDTLRNYGFNVISELRPPNTDKLEYADKVAKKINALLESGISPEDIAVVGASAGGSIAVDVSIKVKNSKIKYAVLGVCRWEGWKAYLHENKLCGNFLSIYESSDSYGSCEGYFNDQNCMSGYKEIQLNMNNGHGFLYKPYRQWVHPLVKWINGQEDEIAEMPQENGHDDSYRKAESGFGLPTRNQRRRSGSLISSLALAAASTPTTRFTFVVCAEEVLYENSSSFYSLCHRAFSRLGACWLSFSSESLSSDFAKAPPTAVNRWRNGRNRP